MIRSTLVAMAATLLFSTQASAQDARWGMWGDSQIKPGKKSASVFAPLPKMKKQGSLAQALDPDEQQLKRAVALASGGPKPNVARLAPKSVSFSGYKPGSVVIDTSGRKLYYVTSSSSALRYPITVGKQGFTWTGTQKVSRIASWPDWTPPAEMRQRKPHLPMKMTGGINNPLGAKAIYLGSSLYRIHGTNDGSSIGQAASSGCFRMYNGHVVDLASRVSPGTTVHVLRGLPRGIAKAKGGASA